MASRQLRKLRKQQELLSLQKEAAERSEESDDGHIGYIAARPRGNMFSGFAALGNMGGADEEDEDEVEDQQNDTAEPAPQQSHQEPAKKSKRSKKKKKKKGKQAGSPAQAEDGGTPVDEIDRVLEELKLEAQQQAGPVAAPAPTDKPARGLNELLGINFHHLKVMNEMRRIFGKAMDVAEVEERAQEARQRTLPRNIDLETYLSARAAHPSQGPRANKGMFDTLLRTNPFIDGKKSWPRGSALGLSMVRVTQGQQEEVEFAFAHDKTYDALEGAFFGLVEMFDDMQIVHFLHRYPYHVSSLIQVSKVARRDQNSALAVDLIERALFTFGRVSLSEFRRRLERGLARMDFARPENRQFFLAGYNLVQKLVLKGAYRTALEWAKVFVSINRADPYAMLNWVHVLAIRAREARWFIDLCDSSLFQPTPPATSPYAHHTVPLAHLQLKDADTAKAVLIKNMETAPWLYCALFSALNLDTPRSVWAAQPRDADENLHIQLYIHMARDLWDTPQATALLKEAGAAAGSSATPAAPPSPPVGLAAARFVYLDNTPALMAAVPRQLLHTASPNFDFDPLPPARDENVFSNPAQRLPFERAEQQDAATPRRRAEALLRAIRARMPPGQDGEEEEDDLDVQAALEEILGVIGDDGREAVPGGERGGGGGGDNPEDGEREEEGQQQQQQQQQEQERPRRRRPPGGPETEPGLINYLLNAIFPGDEVEPLEEDWTDPTTNMPGGWEPGDEDDDLHWIPEESGGQGRQQEGDGREGDAGHRG